MIKFLFGCLVTISCLSCTEPVKQTNPKEPTQDHETGNYTGGVLYVKAFDDKQGPAIEMYDPVLSYAPDRKGAFHFVSEQAGINDGEAFNFIDHKGPGKWTTLMCIYKNGKVAIADAGTDVSAPGYNLFVQKGILTEKVTVAVKNSKRWADHVFDEHHQLMPISEVAAYAQKNKHLPGIPGTADVMKNGLDLGANQAKLLEKIEELTLYVAKQQREIEELKKELGKK
jgi:hypothetical protein